MTNWQEFIGSLTPSDWFLTKENGELVNSFLQYQSFEQQKKFQEWFANLEPCKIGKFILIRKIGNQLLTNQKNRLDAINKSQELYINWCSEQVKALTAMSDSFSNNPIVDVKQAVLSLIIETQIVTQITRLGTQTTLLEEELKRGHFCLECCDNLGEGF